MKTTVLFYFLFTTILYCQNFPGINVELLSNKEIKVLAKDENLQKFGFSDFYVDNDLKTKYECCETYNSKYLSLVNKIFKVIDYQQYKNINGTIKYKLKIENSETGMIYFDYDPKYDFKFPFEIVGGLTFPEGFYCKSIQTNTDKFTGEVKFNSEYSEGISFIKIQKENASKIYISINKPGSTLAVGKKGLILLLENNKRIEKPETTINVKANSNGGFTYSSFVELNINDIALLKNYKITDTRLYIYDGTIKNGEKLKEFVKCLTK